MKKDVSAPPGNASLVKGLILLERILGDRGRTPLVDLVGDLQLTRSTLYRLLGALEQRGLIIRIGRGRYDIGVPLTERVRGVSLTGQIARVARPFLLSLARECRATAHLGVMDNEMVTYLVKASTSVSRSAQIFTRENSQLEAYCSGIGKVLLAWQPEAERERYLAGGPFVPITPNTITDPEVLRACLARVRSEGFAVDDGEIEADLYCLAVPLLSPETHRRRGNLLVLQQQGKSPDPGRPLSR